jgi:hypothetical protein
MYEDSELQTRLNKNETMVWYFQSLISALGPLWEGSKRSSSSGSTRSPPKRVFLQRLRGWSSSNPALWSTLEMSEPQKRGSAGSGLGSATVYQVCPCDRLVAPASREAARVVAATTSRASSTRIPNHGRRVSLVRAAAAMPAGRAW